MSNNPITKSFDELPDRFSINIKIKHNDYSVHLRLEKREIQEKSGIIYHSYLDDMGDAILACLEYAKNYKVEK
jgi:hypothetical protein